MAAFHYLVLLFLWHPQPIPERSAFVCLHFDLLKDHLPTWHSSFTSLFLQANICQQRNSLFEFLIIPKPCLMAHLCNGKYVLHSLQSQNKFGIVSGKMFCFGVMDIPERNVKTILKNTSREMGALVQPLFYSQNVCEASSSKKKLSWSQHLQSKLWHVLFNPLSQILNIE